MTRGRVRQTPAPGTRPVRATASAGTGGWQVQLGAFGDAGNARRRWAQIGDRFPGRRPAYIKSGKLTKLLVGGFATRADAARACVTVSPCVPVAP